MAALVLLARSAGTGIVAADLVSLTLNGSRSLIDGFVAGQKPARVIEVDGVVPRKRVHVVRVGGAERVGRQELSEPGVEPARPEVVEAIASLKDEIKS